MSDWKSCGNCSFVKNCGLQELCFEPSYELWIKIPCQLCGGTMSEIRESNGKRYRHCYSCHMEQEEPDA